MRITDVTVHNFAHPMVAMHRARFQGPQEISLVRIVTDVGLERHAMARAQGGASG